MSQPLIDLNLAFRQFERGQITVTLTWALTNKRPVMVLTPTYQRIGADRITPCIVPLELAYKWDETMGDAQHCAHTSYLFASNLGFSPMDPQTLFTITSIIRDYLGDLLMMPPAPQSEIQTVADVQMTDTETGKVVEAEIVDHV